MIPPDFTITWRMPDGSERKADGYPRFNLLAHADLGEIDIPQACGGQAECGTCRIRILSGDVTESRGDEDELMTKHHKRFGDRERLACRARPRSDLTVEVLAIMPPDLRDIEPGE
ncbi:MAG: ferredoxin [Myxococcota bacterium]